MRRAPCSASLLRLRLPLLLVLTALIGLGAAAPAAWAHAALRTSDPADGSTVRQLPERVELVFNEAVNPDLGQVVIDAAGTSRRVSPEELEVSGPAVRAPLPQDLPSGTVTVRYRIVSADSHPVTGQIAFTYAGAPTTSAAPGATSSPAAPSAEQSSTAPSVTALEPASDEGEGRMFALMGVAAIGALVIALVFVWSVRARRRRGE